MNEFDGDFVEDFFDDYLQQTTVQIRPPGTAAAVKAVRNRRRKRAITVAVAAILLVIVPVAAYAIVSRPSGQGTPPVASASPESPNPAAPSPNTSPVPDSETYVPSIPVPQGGFTVDQLKNATFTLPSWDDTSYSQAQRCTSGRRTFTDSISEPAVYLGSALSYVDLERDGQFETIIGLACRQPNSGQAVPSQVVVLRRGAGGAIETVGQVVTTKQGIKSIAIGQGMRDGSIRVRVENGGLCCAEPYTDAQHQLRTYKWDGQKFAQSAGSTEFYPNSADADIAVTTAELVFGAPTDGKRTGKVILTVTNAGTKAVEGVLLILSHGGASVQGDGWTVRPDWGSGNSLQWRAGALTAGQSVQIELTATTTETMADKVSLSVLGIPVKANGDELRDTKPFNNLTEGTFGIEVKVKFS